MRYYCTVIAVLIADQILKYYIRANLALGDILKIIPGLFELTHVSNSGAAWGAFSESTLLLTAFSAIVSLALLIFIGCGKKLFGGYKWAFALIAGGGVGNLIDRVLFGAVTDMFSLSFFSPVFNIADISVCIGCFIMTASICFEENLRFTKR